MIEHPVPAFHIGASRPYPRSLLAGFRITAFPAASPPPNAPIPRSSPMPGQRLRPSAIPAIARTPPPPVRDTPTGRENPSPPASSALVPGSYYGHVP